MTPKKKRTPVQIMQDRIVIAQLYVEGKTQTEIAEQMGLSQQRISVDLRGVRAAWKERGERNLEELRAEQLAKIDHLERMYWDEWFRSKSESVTTEQEQDETTGKSRKKAKVKKQSQLGDPKYLQGVQWCISKRCEIFGLDAPKKVNVNDQRLMNKIPWDSLTKDQLRRIINGEDPRDVIPGLSLD